MLLRDKALNGICFVSKTGIFQHLWVFAIKFYYLDANLDFNFPPSNMLPVHTLNNGQQIPGIGRKYCYVKPVHLEIILIIS